jgi:hypothetical protein
MYDKLNDPLRDIPSQKEGDEEDHGHFAAARGQRQPPRISIRRGQGRTSVRYALMDDITFNEDDMPADTIVIPTTTSKITIHGKGLKSLMDYLEREKVYVIREADPSKVALEKPASYVESIEIVPRE